MRPRNDATGVRAIAVFAVFAVATWAPRAVADPANVTLGDDEQLLAGLDQLVHIGAADARGVPAGSTDVPSSSRLVAGNPGETDPYTLPRLGIDWVAARRLTLGVGALVYATLGRDPAAGEAPYVTVLAVAPRVGWLAPIAPSVALWLRAGASYYVLQERGVDGAASSSVAWSFTWRQLDASLETHLVFTAFPHVAISAGLAADAPVLGRLDERRAGNPSDVRGSASWLHVGLVGGILAFL